MLGSRGGGGGDAGGDADYGGGYEQGGGGGGYDRGGGGGGYSRGAGGGGGGLQPRRWQWQWRRGSYNRGGGAPPAREPPRRRRKRGGDYSVPTISGPIRATTTFRLEPPRRSPGISFAGPSRGRFFRPCFRPPVPLRLTAAPRPAGRIARIVAATAPR